jgi:hypothetical protein
MRNVPRSVAFLLPVKHSIVAKTGIKPAAGSPALSPSCTAAPWLLESASAHPTLIWCLQCIATRCCIKLVLRFTLFRALRPAPFATAYLTCASTRIPPAPTCAALRLDHSELHTMHAQCHAALLSPAVFRGRRLRQARAAPPRDAHCWRQRRCAMRTATTSATACAALTVSITPDLICSTSDTAGVLPCICSPCASLCALCLHRPRAVTARHARLVQ